MKRGPKPKSAEAKALAGNPGGRPLATDPILRPHFRPPPLPRQLWLKTYPKTKKRPAVTVHRLASACWRRISKELHHSGMLPVLATDALIRYCLAYEDYWINRAHVEEHGAVVLTDKGNPVLSAYAIARDRAAATMSRLEAEFGMTPASKSGISVKPVGRAAPGAMLTPDEIRKRRFFGDPA